MAAGGSRWCGYGGCVKVFTGVGLEHGHRREMKEWRCRRWKGCTGAFAVRPMFGGVRERKRNSARWPDGYGRGEAFVWFLCAVIWVADVFS